MKRIILLLGLLTLLITACSTSKPVEDSENQKYPTTSTVEFDLSDWDSVLAAAEGQTVNWYIWGGSDSINAFVDNFYGQALQDRYGITLNRVPIADTVDAVNQVLSEKQAGTDPGVVDLIWINGENFFTLKQAGLLYPDWAQQLPNSQYVDWDNPAINRDFGNPVDQMESPWSSAQLQWVYDSARMSTDELPRSYADFKTWACEHPGRATYVAPGPGGFIGTRFVKGALFELSGGAAQWATFDQVLWDQWAPVLWNYLNELETCLWRNGETYPQDEAELRNLFANNEVDFGLTQDISGAGSAIAQGLVPETARAFVFDRYMIGDFNYVAIPANAPHKAAALVLANLLLEPEFQAAQILPENGFGLGYAIDVNRVSDRTLVAQLQESADKLGQAATPASELANSLVGDAAPEYQALVEQGWLENVLQK
ncbi:MAG: ABC transporter substrate-binding protein [Anaerolineales bacterium]|nr:ABC transporter substrate-binding protein [Anaerolineales bacterium]